jgi:tricorn protease-like protein
LACFREQIEIPAQEGQPSSIYAMKKSSNGKYFVAISTHNYSNEHRGIIRAWDAENLSMVCETPGIYALFSPFDDSLVVMNKRGDTISYFDVEKCSETRALKLPAYPKKQEMEFTPDGKYIVLLRHGFQIIDAENGNLVLDDKSDIFAAFGVLHISPGGKYLLSEHADNGPVTALWNIDYGQVP